jgi:serine/threonine-protein kinase RsbW
MTRGTSTVWEQAVSESLTEGAASTDVVELTVPADPAYIAVLRTVTASLAARRDFTLDEIDDLRIAVDEACALLLPHARPASSLSAVFGGTGDELQVLVSIELADGFSDSAAVLDRTTFAWMVLIALTDSVTSAVTGGRLTLTFTKARDARN